MPPYPYSYQWDIGFFFGDIHRRPLYAVYPVDLVGSAWYVRLLSEGSGKGESKATYRAQEPAWRMDSGGRDEAAEMGRPRQWAYRRFSSKTT